MILERDERSEAKVAADLGMSRQRLYQLKTANRVASSEAIAEVIERLGYKLKLELEDGGQFASAFANGGRHERGRAAKG